MNRPEPDHEYRILVATAALIVIIAFAVGGHGIWDFAGRPLP